MSTREKRDNNWDLVIRGIPLTAVDAIDVKLEGFNNVPLVTEVYTDDYHNESKIDALSFP